MAQIKCKGGGGQGGLQSSVSLNLRSLPLTLLTQGWHYHLLIAFWKTEILTWGQVS